MGHLLDAPIHVVKPELEFLDPNMGVQDKIARMARICYKSESTGTGSDAKLIANCVARGHHSVTEHALISVVFSGQNINKDALKKVFPNVDPEGVSPKRMFEAFSSLDIRRYVLDITDPDILRIVDPEFVATHNDKTYSIEAKLANARAWYRIVDAIISLGFDSEHYPHILSLGLSLLKALFGVAPAMYGKIVTNVEKYLAALAKVDAGKIPNQDFPTDFESCCKAFGADLFDVWANKASPAASMSVILKTSRSVTHEIVRHNHTDIAVSQESQRYVNYNNKGFEFIHPMLDVVRFSDLPLATEGGTATVTIDKDGFIPEESIVYKRWLAGRRADVDEYMGDLAYDLPPEFCRGALPNDAATTIGITFTYPSFINFVKLRLDNTAFFPFRKFVAELLIRGLVMKHPFLIEFSKCSGSSAASMLGWIKHIRDDKLYTDEEAVKTALGIVEDIIFKAKEAAEAAQKAQQEVALMREKAVSGPTVVRPAPEPATEAAPDTPREACDAGETHDCGDGCPAPSSEK